MKVVVTGATGHLGTYVVSALAEQGHEVVALSRSGARPRLPFGMSPQPTNLRGVALDITRDEAVPALAAELGPGVALVHLAGLHPPNTAGTGPRERRELLAANVYGTMRVLEAARIAGVSIVAYSSSFEVYGEVEDLPVTEASRVTPLTDYGASKLAGEDHLLAFAFEQKVRVFGLRFPAIYGPGEKTARALPNFLRAVLRGERPCIQGDGEDLRDQIHARDAALAFCCALTRESGSGLYNVADGQAHSIGELARLALKLGGMSGEPESAPRVKPRRDYHMSIERARQELGFEPRVGIEAGMAEELAWLRSGVTA